MAGAPALLTSSLLATPIGIGDEPSALTHSRRDAHSETQPQRFAQLGKTFSVGNAVARPGEKIPLKVTLASGLNPDVAFVMFMGLPADFRISAGVKTKDAWAVSLREVSGLSLIPPNGWEGVLELDVVLVRGKDAPPDRQTIIILVKPDDLTDRVAKAETASPPTAFTELDEKPPLPRLPAEMSSEDTAFLQRGDQLLDTGDVAAARLFFTRLAKKGVAMGALRMARTYDPEFLGSMRTAGLQPDLPQARVWYQKASELGSQDATKRLSTLSSAEPR
ncbi:MAG: hypothetical protein SGJ17_14255 [Hyphomicrobiales bacterium]|nr:hypothetical protein [Hyphomicrobiales bacterium]